MMFKVCVEILQEMCEIHTVNERTSKRQQQHKKGSTAKDGNLYEEMQNSDVSDVTDS